MKRHLTPDHGLPSLCSNCIHGTDMRGQRESDRMIYCGIIRKAAPFHVIDCTDHEMRGGLDEPTLWHIAWTVKRENGKFIGFVPPKSRHED